MATIRAQLSNCHTSLSPNGRMRFGTIKINQHTKATIPFVLRMILLYVINILFVDITQKTVFYCKKGSGGGSAFHFININKVAVSFQPFREKTSQMQVGDTVGILSADQRRHGNDIFRVVVPDRAQIPEFTLPSAFISNDV